MKYRFSKISWAALLLLLWLGACRAKDNAQDTLNLPRSTPEAEGVPSERILAFIEAVENSPHELHSFMFLRHGKVIAEGWWAPYHSDLKHTLYSTSKSFTSTAVGFAVSEKLLTVEDKVVTFFPEELPDSVSPFLADMSVKDLLMMSAGQEPDPTRLVVGNDSNWVRAFLAIPVVHDPGTVFLYNSLATYMLSAIVQQVTGEKVMDYLTPRLFEPLNIKGIDWEIDPRGINTGGWGLRVKTEDMARFGQLYLQQGVWNGKQILPAEWIEEATTFKIDNAPGAPQAARDSSEWAQGYCYQFWRCRYNAYRADGAYGQYIIVMPEQDAVIAIQAETNDMQGEINLVWQYLLPAMQAGKLPENNEATDKLRQKLASLALPLPPKAAASSLTERISGKTFRFTDNDPQIEALNLHFMGDICHATLTAGGTDHVYILGARQWITGETTRLGPNLLRGARAHFSGLPPAKVAGLYNWKEDHTLEIILRYIESPHTETMICRFDGDKITLSIKHSQVPGTSIVQLQGEATGNR